MLTGNHALYRTLSCRTSGMQALQRLKQPVNPLRVLMLLVLAGTGLGTLLLCKLPACAAFPLLTQGLPVTDTLRTLWDVFCAAVLPMLVLLGGVLLFSGWSVGQPFLLALPVLRGVAAGIAAADCFQRMGLRTGMLTAALEILPYAFLSALILLCPVRDALTLSCKTAAYLLKGAADPEITDKRQRLLHHVLRAMLLTVPAAGLHTLLVWAMDRI